MKLRFFDKRLLRKTGTFFLTIGTLIGIAAIFYGYLIEQHKLIILLSYFLITILYHVVIYCYNKKLNNLTLEINNSTFIIKTGNIFEQSDLKVINFNEYFDTIVDDKIIAKNSLNGQFINKYVKDVDKLDSIITDSLKNHIFEINDKRPIGKKIKYILGSIVQYNDFILTSFTKFDKDNRANTSLIDFLNFLMNFWDNLDKIYANRSVSITLFGSSSLTRFRDVTNITEQDLIELIIWSFKVSKIKFKYPTTISMILPEELLKKINLYDLKERYKDGI